MARVCVVGNATHDLIRTGLISTRRPGGTMLYASLALNALGHHVHAIGYAPLRAYMILRFAGVDTTHLKMAIRGTRFLNKYEDQHREQWALKGPPNAIEDPSLLENVDGILLGPVLGEIPPNLPVPPNIPSVLDIQGTIRQLGESNLWGYQRVHIEPTLENAPDSRYIRGSFEEIQPLLDENDPESAAETLAQRANRTAIVTLGAHGAIAYDGKLHRVQTTPVEADDPTGAGDVFDAGFLHGLLENASLEECLEQACTLAGWFLKHEDKRRLTDRFPGSDRFQQRIQGGES